MLPLCLLIRCILFSVFYVLPSGVINDNDDDFEFFFHRIRQIFGPIISLWLKIDL